MSHFWQIFNIFDQSFGWKWPSGAIVERKKKEFLHQNSALPIIFFKILQKARFSRIFQIRAFRKSERAEPRLGSNTSKKVLNITCHTMKLHNCHHATLSIIICFCMILHTHIKRNKLWEELKQLSFSMSKMSTGPHTYDVGWLWYLVQRLKLPHVQLEQASVTAC